MQYRNQYSFFKLTVNTIPILLHLSTVMLFTFPADYEFPKESSERIVADKAIRLMVWFKP